jgi:hypothetical protein
MLSNGEIILKFYWVFFLPITKIPILVYFICLKEVFKKISSNVKTKVEILLFDDFNPRNNFQHQLQLKFHDAIHVTK